MNLRGEYATKVGDVQFSSTQLLIYSFQAFPGKSLLGEGAIETIAVMYTKNAHCADIHGESKQGSLLRRLHVFEEKTCSLLV